MVFSRRRILILGLKIVLIASVIYYASNWSRVQVPTPRSTPSDITRMLNGEPAHQQFGERNPLVQMVVRSSTVATMNKNLMGRLFCMLWRTMTLFWSPILGESMVVIMDDEREEDHEFGRRLMDMAQNFTLVRPVVVYEKTSKSPVYFKCADSKKDFMNAGYLKQLYSSFFMDRYSNASVIGWLDSDVIFISPPAPRDVFDDGRVVAYGSSKADDNLRYWFMRNVEVALGKPPIADFMTQYFPEYLWRDTFSNFRRFAMKRFNTSDFDDVFEAMCRGAGTMCPVCVLYNYAWYFERDRYSWYLEYNHPQFTKFYSPHFTSAKVTGNVRRMKMHHAVHEWRKTGQAKRGTGYLLTTHASYCHLMLAASGGNNNSLPVCERFRKEGVPLRYFGVSERHMCSGNVTKCQGEVKEHYKKLKPFVQNGTFPLDVKHIKNVEQISNQLGLSCPAFDFY